MIQYRSSHQHKRGLNEWIEKLTVDAHHYDENYRSFLQAMGDHLSRLTDGFVIGDLIAVIEIGYDGNGRRSLTVDCSREESKVR